MKEKNKNEELQSRREFFKEAAKKTLPVIGAVVLASSPIIAKAAEKNSMGCDGSCYGRCSGTCSGTCSGSCDGACSFTCKGSCKGYCAGACMGGCQNSSGR